MALVVPITLVANTLASADDVNTNFDAVESYVNGSTETITAHNADIALLPKGKQGYAQVTANQGSITTVVDLSGLSVTFTALASRYYRITGQIIVASTTATDRIDMIIADGAGTQLNVIFGNPAVANQAITLHGSHIIQPGAGSKTYKLRCQRGVGAGTVTMTGAANTPDWILVEDIGL